MDAPRMCKTARIDAYPHIVNMLDMIGMLVHVAEFIIVLLCNFASTNMTKSVSLVFNHETLPTDNENSTKGD